MEEALYLVNVACGPAGQERNMGSHFFVSVPRIGDFVTIRVEGELQALTVEAVFHSGRSVDATGSPGGPYVTIRTRLR
jgi:hypothetical protein